MQKRGVRHPLWWVWLVLLTALLAARGGVPICIPIGVYFDDKKTPVGSQNWCTITVQPPSAQTVVKVRSVPENAAIVPAFLPIDPGQTVTGFYVQIRPEYKGQRISIVASCYDNTVEKQSSFRVTFPRLADPDLEK